MNKDWKDGPLVGPPCPYSSGVVDSSLSKESLGSFEVFDKENGWRGGGRGSCDGREPREGPNQIRGTHVKRSYVFVFDESLVSHPKHVYTCQKRPDPPLPGKSKRGRL